MAAFSARRAGYLLSICCHLTPMTTVAAGGGAASRCRGRLGQLTRLAVVPRVVFPLRKQRQEISVAGCDRPDRSLVKLLRRVPPGSSFDSAAEDLCRLAVLGSDICSKVIASRPYGLAATATDRTATATARTAIRLGHTGSAAGTRSNFRARAEASIDTARRAAVEAADCAAARPAARRQARGERATPTARGSAGSTRRERDEESALLPPRRIAPQNAASPQARRRQ